MSLGLESEEDISEIVAHFEKALSLANAEIGVAAANFRDVAVLHAPVLTRLDDLVAFEALASDELDNYQLPSDISATGSPFGGLDRVSASQILGKSFTEVIVVRRLIPTIELDVRGPGFVIKVTETPNPNYEVTFPLYPEVLFSSVS